MPMVTSTTTVSNDLSDVPNSWIAHSLTTPGVRSMRLSRSRFSSRGAAEGHCAELGDAQRHSRGGEACHSARMCCHFGHAAKLPTTPPTGITGN
jgi:hypothetical protein